jgi:hypothetical protein
MSEINEAKRDAIRKEAKGILNKFAKTLEKVKLKGKIGKQEVGGFRIEGEGKVADARFREIMFKNAPNKNDNSIIAEKKSW